MKIGVDYREAVKEKKAGKGFVVFELMERWKGMVVDDDVYLLADQDFDISSWPHNFHKVVYRLPSWIWHIRVVWEVWWKYDVYLALTSYLVPWLSGSKKCVIFVHDLIAFDKIFAEKHNVKATRIERMSLGGALRVCKKVIAPSQTTLNDLGKMFMVEEQKKELIWEGVNRYSGEIDIEGTKNKYKIDKDYIFFVSTLEPRKNLDRLITAFWMIKKDKIWDGKLVLAGKKGWYYESLFDLVDRLQMQNDVLFIGYVSEREKYSLISGSSCVACVSLYEGFGLPILEAFSMGIPVVTSNVSSMPEVAGDAAVKVDPEDTEAIYGALKMVLLDKQFARLLVEKGNKRLKMFDWNVAAKRIYEISIN